MFEHIPHVSLALYICTNGFMHLRAQLFFFFCTYIFVGKILKSMCDCCKSIFKLVMNDQSIIMLVLIHVQTCAYIFFHFFFLFFCFCSKSLTNVNFKMEGDNELQKPSHILVFDQEKGKTIYMNMYDAQKPKACSSN